MARKILYLSPYFWPEEIGSSSYCTDLAVWLSGRGHEVRAVSFRPHYPSASAFQEWAGGARDEERYAGLSISRVAVRDRGGGGVMDRLKIDLAFLGRVCRRALKGEFRGTDVVVAYVPTIFTLYGAKLVGILTGAPIVCVVHDIESGLASSLGFAKNRALLFVMRIIERVGLNFARDVVVLTEGMREELRRLGCGRPITVLPIWASAAPFKPVEEGAEPVLMYSGNFGKKQNLDQLFPLIKRLSDEKKPLGVHLRGDGSEKERLKAQALNLGLSNITFLPLAAADEFLGVLQAAHIHLVPQALNVANYALPSKLFSIMSAGRPFICIAEKNSPLDRLAAESEAGICVRPGDEEGLYREVLALAGDKERQNRMGQNAARFVDKNMNKENILKAYEALIEKDVAA